MDNITKIVVATKRLDASLIMHIQEAVVQIVTDNMSDQIRFVSVLSKPTTHLPNHCLVTKHKVLLNYHPIDEIIVKYQGLLFSPLWVFGPVFKVCIRYIFVNFEWANQWYFVHIALNCNPTFETKKSSCVHAQQMCDKQLTQLCHFAPCKSPKNDAGHFALIYLDHICACARVCDKEGWNSDWGPTSPSLGCIRRGRNSFWELDTHSSRERIHAQTICLCLCVCVLYVKIVDLLTGPILEQPFAGGS